LPAADLATQRDRAFADQSCAVEKKLARLRLRRFLQTQGILFSIGAFDLPDALGSAHTFWVSPRDDATVVVLAVQ
jgi:hypothetical protein